MASKSPGMAMPFYAHLSSHDFEHPDGLPTSEWNSKIALAASPGESNVLTRATTLIHFIESSGSTSI